MIHKARFFDGESPREHEVTVASSGSFLSISYEQNGFRKEQSFRISDLDAETDGDDVVIAHEGKTIIMPKAVWKKMGPRHQKNWKDFIIPGSIALSIFFSLFFWHDQIIESLSKIVPQKMMDQAANSVKEEYSRKNCLNKKQEEVIESVFMRLGKNKDEYTLYLIASTEENAFAMPGNIIIFHDAILKKLDSLEAFAGILAHEVSHLDKKHLERKVVKSLLFQWASFAIFGGADGGALVSAIIEGKYNQSEEKEADVLAARILREAEINPSGTQNFFSAGEKKEDVFTKYLVLSHPDYADRIKTFAPAQINYRPMNKDDWKILKKGCQSNL